MTTIIICDSFESSHADVVAQFDEFRKTVEQVERIARELLKALLKFRPPVKADWPRLIPKSPRAGRYGRSTNAPVYQICGRWPSGYRKRKTR
ncbi:hypothetical protein [Gimesia algae]|uniref:Uncharacterized protein n=1 Tax=Gimesia algae TaxID=2527971 RepID=A0A517VF34_9PLAN|nr:hypothetical protein [Gimesia algae]QDT91628.1 hypothetical protein Pan161_32900 [Gimesia algae]